MSIFNENTSPLDTPSNSPFAFSTAQTELLDWFRKKAAPLAEAYDGAVRLLSIPGFPCRVHFIAHAVRDIGDRLIYALDPQEQGKRVQYETELDKIVKGWPIIDPASDAAASPVDKESLIIPYHLARLIDGLVTAHRNRRQRPTQYELLFRHLMKQESAHAAVNERLIQGFKKTHKWFTTLAHVPAEGPKQVDENELRSEFKKFETMLHSFVGNFFTGKSELDAILRQANK